MKRLRAHLEIEDKNNPGVKITSDWNGHTYPYIKFPIPGSFPIYIEYSDIDYKTGDIKVWGLKEKVMKSGVRFVLDNYQYRYNGYIDYEMYDDNIPCDENTLQIKVFERVYSEVPSSNRPNQKQTYFMPYKIGAELETKILGYKIRVVGLYNEEIDVLINGFTRTIKIDKEDGVWHREAVCYGNTEDSVYQFGDEVLVSLIIK